MMKKTICVVSLLIVLGLTRFAGAQTELDIEIVETDVIVESPMETVNRVLALTDAEIGVLEVTQSRRADVHGAGVILMLSKASQLPELSPEQLDTLQRPTHGSLIKFPARYQGLPIRLTIYVHSVMETMLSGFDRPVWQINAYDADGEEQKGLLIYSLQDPLPLLPPPSEQTRKGLMVFNPQQNPGGTKLIVAGILVKTFEDEVAVESFDPNSPSTGLRMDVPLFVAWQVSKPQVAKGIPTATKLLILLVIVALVAMVVLFTMLSKNIRRKRLEAMDPATRWHGRYTPFRDTDLDDLPDEERHDTEQIDPELRAAAEALHHPDPDLEQEEQRQ
jgi:hypothetical protein